MSTATSPASELRNALAPVKQRKKRQSSYITTPTKKQKNTEEKGSKTVVEKPEGYEWVCLLYYACTVYHFYFLNTCVLELLS